MSVLVLQVFVSLMLVAGSLLLFAHSSRQRDHEQADRLALFPLEADAQPAPGPEPLPRSSDEDVP